MSYRGVHKIEGRSYYLGEYKNGKRMNMFLIKNYNKLRESELMTNRCL
jgi:hypothetical protein